MHGKSNSHFIQHCQTWHQFWFTNAFREKIIEKQPAHLKNSVLTGKQGHQLLRKEGVETIELYSELAQIKISENTLLQIDQLKDVISFYKHGAGETNKVGMMVLIEHTLLHVIEDIERSGLPEEAKFLEHFNANIIIK